MNKIMPVAVIPAAFRIGGCSGLHDRKGWEHSGDDRNHQVENSSSIFEHKH